MAKEIIGNLLINKNELNEKFNQLGEIPVTDFSRARHFYEEVFQIDMHIMQMEENAKKWGFFPFDP
jgi:predicted enzyme related to lactoylglutathione lyase